MSTEATPLNPSAEVAGRSSHLFFGCCDCRRATIIVDIISNIMTLLGVLGLVVAASGISDDDEVTSALEQAPYGTGFAWTYFSAALVCCTLGMIGAMKFKSRMVWVAIIWYSLNVAWGLFGLDLFGIVFSAIFLYPHIFFYQEMKNGVMTEAGYPVEKYSCCCV